MGHLSVHQQDYANTRYACAFPQNKIVHKCQNYS